MLDGALLLQEAEQAGGNLDASTLLLSGTLSEAVSRLDALEILALPNHRHAWPFHPHRTPPQAGPTSRGSPLQRFPPEERRVRKF